MGVYDTFLFSIIAGIEKLHEVDACGFARLTTHLTRRAAANSKLALPAILAQSEGRSAVFRWAA